MKSLGLLRGLFFFGLVALVCSCVPDIEKESPGLANRGILPLSTNEPFLGSNIFLAQEMQRSSYLHNFIKNKGGPAAIELTQDFGKPPHMVLFYPRKREVYAAERVIKKGQSGKINVQEWIIRGPYAIERKDYRELASMDLSMQGEPVFYLWGKQVRFGAEKPASRIPEAVLTPVLPPTPPPTPKPTPVKKKPAVIKSGGEAEDPEIKNFKPLNSDQQAIRIAQGYAERSSNGDVIHTVKKENETLAMIAKWYTGSEGNAAELASLNGLSPELIVPQGARVRVPMRLLKKLKAMP
jgi:hypothetical protein